LLLLKVYHRGERIGYDALQLPGSEPIPFARVAGREPPEWNAGEKIGCFSLSESAVRAANDRLVRAAAEAADVIIDEVGPLELAGGGLSRGVRAVLASTLERVIYLVVRRECLPKVCDRFGIRGYTVVEVGAD
jgi:nucleoside-triphosphatase THEP1